MEATPRDGLRLAELIAALSLATDLGLGQPMAHALRPCLIAIGLGRVRGLPERQLADTYSTTLLRFVGCTSDSHELRDFAAGEDVRFRQLMVAVGNDTPDEVAPHLARFTRADRRSAHGLRRLRRREDALHARPLSRRHAAEIA